MKTTRLTITFFMAATLIFSMAGCGNVDSDSESNRNSQVVEDTQSVSDKNDGSEKEGKSEEMKDKMVAKDGADMQTDDKSMPTRKLPGNGTKINMHFGDTVIPGVLNDSETAKALIEKLPVTVHMNRYSHDFCGSASELNLPYKDENVHYGWLNGDIDYAIDAPWFTILFEDEDVSEQYGYQVNIGVIDCPLSKISKLDGDYDVLVEIAK